jgi:uncharacterized protein YebE (UPF0316 family)
MLQGFDYPTILLGVVIFLARVTDVSMGTMRTISIVQGRTKIAFLLGFVEVSMWLVIISTVIHRISEQPILGVFYALGFSTGNVVGIILEKRIAFGHIILRIINTESGKEMKPSCPLTSRNTLAYSGHNKDLSFSLSLFSEPPFCLEAP